MDVVIIFSYFYLIGVFFILVTGLYGLYYKKLHIQGRGRIYVIQIKEGTFSKKLNRGVKTAWLFIIFGILYSFVITWFILYWTKTPSYLLGIIGAFFVAKFLVNKISDSMILSKEMYDKAKTFKTPPPMLLKEIQQYEEKYGK